LQRLNHPTVVPAIICQSLKLIINGLPNSTRTEIFPSVDNE